jgi:hypothetical protein
MRKYVAVLLVLAVLYGCATPNYQTLKLGNVDRANKSMTVPGAGNALFEIKAALINDGWKIKIGDASLQETGVNTSKVDTRTKVQYETAYRMYMTSTLSNNENHGITTFNISIVSNKTDEEILNMVGNRQDYVRYKPNVLAENLVRALRELER